MAKIEIQCTESQLEAIESPFESDTLVNIIAGPGAGKTKTLVDRIAFALDQGLNPNEIQVFSLTKKTVEDFRLKLIVVLGVQLASQINVTTFHSFCYGLVFERNPQLAFFNPMQRMDPEFIRKYFKINSNVSIDKKNYNEDLLRYDFPSLMSSKMILRKDRIFFDKIVLEAVEIIKKDVDYVLPQCKLIVIDEFQDVSSNIMHLLEHIIKNKHLTIAGDIDQSIYEFTGAFPSQNWGLMDKVYDMNHRKDIVLETSFRLPQNLIKVATNTLHSSTTLLESAINEEEEIRPFRSPFLSIEEEFDFIHNEIEKLICDSNGYIKPKNIAILSHSNSSVNAIGTYFSLRDKFKISRLKDGPTWTGTPLSMILDFLKFMDNFHNDESMILMCRHLHSVGPTTLLKVRSIADALGESIYTTLSDHPELFTPTQQKLFNPLIKYLHKMKIDKNDPESIMFNLLGLCSQTEFRKQLDNMKDVRIERELKELYYDFKTIAKSKPPEENLLTFFNSNYDQSQFFKTVQKKSELEDSITISTIHTAKGREWDIVFITTTLSNTKLAVEELSFDPQCNYVGVTRAKHLLYYNRDHNQKYHFLDISGSPSNNLYKGTLQYLPQLKSRGTHNNLNELPKWGPKLGIQPDNVQKLVSNMKIRSKLSRSLCKRVYQLGKCLS